MLRLAKFGLIFQHVARIVIFSEKLYEKHILRLNAILPKLDVAIIYVSVQQARKVKSRTWFSGLLVHLPT